MRRHSDVARSISKSESPHNQPAIAPKIIVRRTIAAASKKVSSAGIIATAKIVIIKSKKKI